MCRALRRLEEIARSHAFKLQADPYSPALSPASVKALDPRPKGLRPEAVEP